jgi:ADP-ribose pyrophosphatase
MNPESGWNVLTSEPLCETPHLSVHREVLASPLHPSGRTWLTVRRKPAVVVVPMTPDSRFLMIRQERIPARKTFWEFPAGQVDDNPTPEALLETAARELWEETGYESSGGLVELGHFFSSPGFTNEKQTVFLARDIRLSQLPPPNPALEAIHGAEFFSHDQLRERIATGQVCDANSLCAWALLGAYFSSCQ